MAFALTLTALLGAPCASIASAPSAENEPATNVAADGATMNDKTVSRLYQATFGANKRCKMAPGQSAGEFKSEFDRFSAKYPELLNLLKASPYYEAARQRFLQMSASMAARDTPQSLAAECKGLAQLLRSMVDLPEGQKAAHDYESRLAAK
jgi:phosphate-selective porin